MGRKVILTGATGYVGEGVLLECLAHPEVDQVLVVGRRSCGRSHAKLTELLVPDFLELDAVKDRFTGYDGCFFCAGISSVGMGEADYTRATYDTTLAFARAVHEGSSLATFIYVSGAGTNLHGRQMWARVKGRTEQELSTLGFRQQFNFRPGLMTLTPGMRNPKWWMRVLVPAFAVLMPWVTCSMKQVGLAMIHAVQRGYPKNVLEVKDIKALAKA
ncbi:MAG TPA: NAD-dependent epimerase/dehydratase family protein [Flavobacteriales bacterium]|nr:NAD-dependent epimerase/dehydratase family protein [Flavobacteriales bacterium]HMR27807.1 NAD-dependent epimerase/dehydratase family protein [Flavobacteriales bacterium]